MAAITPFTLDIGKLFVTVPQFLNFEASIHRYRISKKRKKQATIKILANSLIATITINPQTLPNSASHQQQIFSIKELQR